MCESILVERQLNTFTKAPIFIARISIYQFITNQIDSKNFKLYFSPKRLLTVNQIENTSRNAQLGPQKPSIHLGGFFYAK